MKRTLFRITHRRTALMALLLGSALMLAACVQPPAPTTTQNTTTKITTTATTAASPTQAATTEPAAVQLVGADEALSILDGDPDALLIDVRTESEFRSGYIEGAQLLPLDQLQARLGELPENKATPLVVYCRSGNRSATAADLLLKTGYTQVYDLGGIIDWPYAVVTE